MDNLSATSSNRSFMDLEASVYSADDLAALVKVWAEQPWPISREKALEWMARQLPQEDVLRRSDYEIVNDGVCLLAPQVDRLLSLISE